MGNATFRESNSMLFCGASPHPKLTPGGRLSAIEGWPVYSRVVSPALR